MDVKIQALSLLAGWIGVALIGWALLQYVPGLTQFDVMLAGVLGTIAYVFIIAFMEISKRKGLQYPSWIPRRIAHLDQQLCQYSSVDWKTNAVMLIILALAYLLARLV